MNATRGRLAGKNVVVVGAGTIRIDDPDPPLGNGREKVAGWQPKWTRFPAGAYTVRRRTSRGSGKA